MKRRQLEDNNGHGFCIAPSLALTMSGASADEYDEQLSLRALVVSACEEAGSVPR